MALVLGAMALVNVLCSFAPVAGRNQKIYDDMMQSHQLPFSQGIVLLSNVRQEQENALAKKPADPYGWARLSYLRRATQADAKGAFAALRMSNMVSPFEPRQLPDRAVMWRELRDVQSPDEQAYQSVLWQKAVGLQGKETWATAVARGLVGEVEKALQEGSKSELLEAWKAQENATGHH
jgi:hypothetical protein